jgi:hypothetical protein
MDQWLIRTSENWIAGPYSKEQVCQMILDGKLGLQDEVCVSDGFWIYIHEREEVKQFLGIEVPKSKLASDDEEVTQTQSNLEEDDITDPDVTQVRTTRPISSSKVLGKSPGKPLEASVPLRRESRSNPQIEIKGHDEKSSLWRGIAWVFVFGSGVLIFVLTRVFSQ